MFAIILTLSLAMANPGGLEAKNPRVDRGQVTSGPVLKQDFELRAQNESIEILDIQSSCGCLKPQISHRKLSAGEQAILTVQVNTLTQPTGQHAWTTTVRYRRMPSNNSYSPVEDRLQLTVRAELIQQITVTPPTVAISATSPVRQLLTIEDRRDRPLTIRGVSSSSPHIRVEMKSRPANASARANVQDVQVTLQDTCPAGHFDEVVQILTDDPNCPELVIPVKIQKTATHAILRNPTEPVIRISPDGSSSSVLVQFRRQDQKPLRILSASSDSNTFALKWSENSGPVVALRISLAGKPIATQGQSKVRVRFQDTDSVEQEFVVSWR